MSGTGVTNPPTSLRLYHLAAATKFTHLPVAGGWYDQHPQLIDEWTTIIALKAERDEVERRRQEAASRQSKPKGRR